MFALTYAAGTIRLVVVAITSAIMTATAAMADDNDSGPYLGAGLGRFDVKIDNLEGVTDAVRDLDSDDSSWKVFFGWRFNPYIGVEADYIDLGNPRGNFDASGTSGDYTVELAGFAGYVIGTLPLGIFELSAKLGYYFHDLEIKVDLDNIGPGNGDVFGSDESSEAVVYGVGAGVTFLEHINAKLEYERMDVDKIDDADTLWLSGAWRF